MSTINGLPAHVLLVHAVVVLIPLSAALLVITAWFPAARRRLSPLAAAIAALALICVPITTDAGDWLEHHLPRTPLLRVHTELGDYMLPWAIALFVATALVAVREHMRTRRTASALDVSTADGPGAAHTAVPADRDGIGGRPMTVALAVLALIVAAGSTVTVYKIGESGARAAWDGKYSQTAIPSPGKQAGGEDG
jgi:hypothetical protein